MAGKNGGARPGAGRKAGGKNAATISKELAREALRVIVMREMEEMTEAQIACAKGIKYLVAREKKTGKFVELSEEQTKLIVSGKDDAHEMIEVWEKQPSTPAYTDLMNRALDKPADQKQEHEMSGTLVVKWQG